LSLKDNCRKFIDHLSSGGLSYAFYRGFKYALYLKELKEKQNSTPENFNIAVKDNLKLIFPGKGISIFWDNLEITKMTGLNCGIRVKNAWTDSSKAVWQVLKREKDYLELRVNFKELPLTQIWYLKIESQESISWKIDLEVKKSIHIDELRFLAQVKPIYKTWINNYVQGDLPRIDGYWRDVILDYSHNALVVGLRHPTQAGIPGSLVLEARDKDLSALLQNSPKQLNLNLIGFKITAAEEGQNYLPGRHHIFSGTVSFFNSEASLDAKIEELRKDNLKKTLITSPAGKIAKRRIRVLLTNLPWQRDGRWGVRAGSRWPHILDDSEENYLPFPFFLSYAAALLQKNDIQIEFIDATAEQIPENIFLEKISRLNFDIVVAETSTPSFYNDLNILNKIHSSLKVPIVICGPHAEINTLEFLKKNNFISYVLFGEYEFSLLGLIKCLETNKDLSSVQGLIWREEKEVIKNEAQKPFDINSLPWPLREGLPMDKYKDLPGDIPSPSVQMLASRGCPFGCTFCLWPQVMYCGNHYRARSIDDVVKEMDYLVRVKGFKSVYFDDDTFNIGKERMLEFCRQIKKRNLQNIPWAIMARADLMDKEILSEMKSAGLRAVKYGVESGSQDSINGCNKNIDLDKLTKIVKITKDLRIKTHLTFCFGFSQETKESIGSTIDYALKLDPDSVQFSILTPFPGTKLFEELDSKKKILTKDWSKYDGHYGCVFSPDKLTVQDLEAYKKKAYLLWAEHKRKKRGTVGDIKLFFRHFKNNGLAFAFYKTLDYLKYVCIKKNSYLNGNPGHKVVIKKAKQCGRKSEPIITRLRNNPRILSIAKGLKYFYSGEARHHYLQLLGVYNGEYAFIGPHHVQIDLTYDCNNNCLACWCNSPLLEEKRLSIEKKKETLPVDLVKRLLDELARIGTKEIYFSGGGEPFIHPQIMEILSFAKQKRFVCYVNTNFTLLNKERIKEIADMGIDYLAVSTWAATPKTYALTHPNKQESDFYNIIDNLRYLNSIKKDKPKIKLHNVIFNRNYFELKELFELANTTGCEFIEFALVDTIPNKTDKLLLSSIEIEALQKLVKEVTLKLNGNDYYKGVKVLNFKSFLRRIESISDLAKATYDRNIIDKMPCYIGWNFSRIMPNGDVNACLKAHRIPVGNLYQEGFRKIWNGKKQRDFRKKVFVYEKNDDFFRLIGNDPEIKEAGCYKSCDDIERNISIHNKAQQLNLLEKKLIKVFSQKPRVKP